MPPPFASAVLSSGALLLVAACGGVTRDEPAGSSDSAGAGGASAATTNDAAASSGAGGDGGLFVSSSSSAGTGGGSPTCAITLDEENYWVTVDHDGTTTNLRAACAEDPTEGTPIGRKEGGGECGSAIVVRACDPARAPAITKLDLRGELVGPGTTQAATGSFVDSGFETLSFTVDELEDVGGYVRGSFQGTIVVDDGGTATVDGKFAVCRIPDLPPCP